MIPAHGYAAKNETTKLEPFYFERKEPEKNELLIDILFCGVCHSDRHQVLNEWKNTIYPCVPGHEIIGRVRQAAPAAKKFKAGDIVGVGPMIDSCGYCDHCKDHTEQYCNNGPMGTYNGFMNHSDGFTNTFGGYSNCIVVKEDFVLRIPESLEPALAAPLLCAGVTTYSPLKHWQVGPGDKVGIIGIGGLGHIAAKIAHAMGAEVSLISTTEDKRKDFEHLGAFEFVHSTNDDQMRLHWSHFDYLLSTIPETHDAKPYLPLLKTDGVFIIVGCLMPLAKPFNMMDFIMERKSVSGSVLGSIEETQELLDFCARYHIAPDVEIIKMDYISEAYDRIKNADVRYRFVVDMSTLPQAKG